MSAHDSTETTDTHVPTTTAPMPLELGTAAGRWMLLVTVLASTMAFLDATAVNVALPAIGTDLGASLSGLQWVVTSYTLALASLILLGGALGDRYGRRRIFLIGVIWFATASILCGLAPTTELLIAARVMQGIGGALLTPAPSPSSRRLSGPKTGRGPSACGPGWVESLVSVARFSAGSWLTLPVGAGSF